MCRKMKLNKGGTDNAYQLQISKQIWSYQCIEEGKTKSSSHLNKADFYVVLNYDISMYIFIQT